MATQETYELTDVTRPRLREVGDKDLTLSFQAGDPRAYDSIYERYSGRVESICQRMLGNSQDAQDAAQEAFLRVYQALPRFNGRYQLGAWITRIATNVCLDHLRARSRSRAEVAPDDVLELVAAAEGGGEDPEQIALRHAEGDRVQETLSGLSPLQRRALFLRDFEGRDYKEIAETLGVSECRARVLLHRARKGFRRSWTSGWVIVGLPARLLHRFRRVKGPSSEQVTHAASSVTQAGHTVAVSPSVLSCTQVIHGCSEIVSERIAAVATVALMGVSAAGAAAPAAFDAPAATRTFVSAVGSAAGLLDPEAHAKSAERHGLQKVVAQQDATGTGLSSEPVADYTLPSSETTPTEEAASTEPDAVPPEDPAAATEDTATTDEPLATEPLPEPTPTDQVPTEDDATVPSGGSTGEESDEPADDATSEPSPDPSPSATPPPDPDGTGQSSLAVEDDITSEADPAAVDIAG